MSSLLKFVRLKFAMPLPRSALLPLPCRILQIVLAQDLDIWGEFPNFAHYLYRQGKIPFLTAFGIVTLPSSHRVAAYAVNRLRLHTAP